MNPTAPMLEPDHSDHMDPFLRKQLELLAQFGNSNKTPTTSEKIVVDQEDEDAKLAKLLSAQLNVQPNNNTNSKDEEFARLLYEEEMRLSKEAEERRKKQNDDENIAKKFYEEEIRLVKEAEERKKKTV